MDNTVNIEFGVVGDDKVQSILKEMQECVDRLEALKSELVKAQITIQATCQ